MDKEKKEQYINNENILYLYNISSSSLFNIEGKDQYIMVVNNSNIGQDVPENIKVFQIADWFELVKNCDILPWICACLNKKYVIKEYVKLLMKTDPLKIRENIDNDMDFTTKNRWEYIMECVLARQIIENHKIINFKEVSKYVPSNINEISFNDFFQNVWSPVYRDIKKLTDGMLEKRNQEILNQKINGKL